MTDILKGNFKKGKIKVVPRGLSSPTVFSCPWKEIRFEQGRTKTESFLTVPSE